MSKRKKRYRGALSVLMLMFLCFAMAVPQQVEAAYTGQETSVLLLNTVIGRYKLNYTGNTNHYAYWTMGGTTKANHVHNDTNGPYANSSTAALDKTTGAREIKYAFLIWETRAEAGVTAKIGFLAPDGKSYGISSAYAINDYRFDRKTMYCMAADVTSIVKNAGYGNYSVCNIPRWDANDHWGWHGGVWSTLGGESPGSWQLIVVEEGDDFPVRAVTLSMGAQFRPSEDFGGTLSLGRGLKSVSTGNVTGQIFFGATNSDAVATMTETITAYDSNGSYISRVLSNTTNSAGLYRNGALVNRRDYQNGCIRMDLSDVSNIGNNATRFELAVQNRKWSSFFFLGAAVDIAYPEFIGEQTTVVNNAQSVTVTGGFTNTAALPDTGIYNGNLTVILDDGLTPVHATAVVDGVTEIAGTVKGHTVTFNGSALSSMMNGSSIRYTVECGAENSGKTRFDNSAGFHGYLRSEGVNTGYWIERMWTAASFGVPKYTVTLHEGYGVTSVIGAGEYSYGSKVTLRAEMEPGFHWKGWTGSYTTAQRDFAFQMPAQNVEMTAEGEANAYTITFNPNGGGETIRPEDIVTQYDARVVLPDGAGYYAKYTLDGVNVTGDVLSGAIMLSAAGEAAVTEEAGESETTGGEPVTAEGPGEAEESADSSEESADSSEESADNPEESADSSEVIRNGWDEEPVPDKKAYASVYMGWAPEELRYGWDPQWMPGDIPVAELATTAGVQDVDGAVITLYAVWDDSPWIQAANLYYTLEEAQSGFITEVELLNHAAASDREDGSPIAPGVHGDGISFVIPDYLPTDFTQFVHAGSCTENLTVTDSAGSTYAKQITVYVVDTSPEIVKPEATTRFITEYYYNRPYENGGLAENSLWRTDPEYVSLIQETFANIRNDTPIATYYFTREQVLGMREYVEEHGIGNSREADALRNFYDRFMAPNQIR